MTSSGGLRASIPIARSSSGKMPKTSTGPKNQSAPAPVSSTSPQVMNGSVGTTRPSSHAWRLGSRQRGSLAAAGAAAGSPVAGVGAVSGAAGISRVPPGSGPVVLLPSAAEVYTTRALCQHTGQGHDVRPTLRTVLQGPTRPLNSAPGKFAAVERLRG